MDKQRLKEIILEEYDKVLKEGFKKKKYRKSDYKKYNKLVKRGKAVLVQTDYGDEFAWEDGSSYGVFASEEDGREIELNHDDIDVVMHEGKLQEGEGLGWSLDWESEIAQLINSKELKTLLKDKNSNIKRIAQRLKKNIIQVHIGFDGLKDELRKVYGEGKLQEGLTDGWKNDPWEVYVRDDKGKEKIMKVAKSKRAAVILYNKLAKTDKYHEVGMRVIGYE